MTMHRAIPLTDGRKRVHKDYPEGVDRVSFPPMALRTTLGLWVRTVFWHDLDALFDSLGGASCGWSRRFAEQHITEEVCSGLVNRRFSGFTGRGNALLIAAKGRMLSRSERVDFKCYRYAWGGFHNQKEQAAEFRFGPGCGPRYWKNNAKLRNHMIVVQNLILDRGPLVQFDYDINQPDQIPVPR